MGQIEQKCVLMLIELFEIEQFLTFNLRTYAKLNFFEIELF